MKYSLGVHLNYFFFFKELISSELSTHVHTSNSLNSQIQSNSEELGKDLTDYSTDILTNSTSHAVMSTTSINNSSMVPLNPNVISPIVPMINVTTNDTPSTPSSTAASSPLITVPTETDGMIRMVCYNGQILEVKSSELLSNAIESTFHNNINTHIGEDNNKGAIINEIKNHIDLKIAELSNELKYYMQHSLFGSNIKPDIIKSPTTQNDVLSCLPLNSIEAMEKFESLLNEDKSFLNETVSYCYFIILLLLLLMQ